MKRRTRKKEDSIGSKNGSQDEVEDEDENYVDGWELQGDEFERPK